MCLIPNQIEEVHLRDLTYKSLIFREIFSSLITQRYLEISVIELAINLQIAFVKFPTKEDYANVCTMHEGI